MNKKALNTIIGESDSEATQSRILLHTLPTICYRKDVSNKLNKSLSEYF